MNERSHHRRPAIFKLDDPGVIVMDADDTSRPPRGTVHIMPEDDPALLPVPVEAPIIPPRQGFRWGAVFWTAVGGLILLGLGLGVTRLIEDLFARGESLGFLGVAFALAAAFALFVVVAREAFGLARLAAIEKLHLRAAAVLLSDDRGESRTIVQDLLKLEHQNPHLARARATLQGHADDIIDGADMIRLAEREPILVWNVSGHRFLVDRGGLLFAPAEPGGPGDGLPSVTDHRAASVPFDVGGQLDPVDLDAATRLASLLPKDLASAATELRVTIEDSDGFEVRPVGVPWVALFGIYTPSLRTPDLIPGQVRLLRSLLAGRELNVKRVTLADDRNGTYVSR